LKEFSRLSIIRQELESGLLDLTDLVSFYLKNIFKVHVNLAGTPAISIPGLRNSNGLPFGIQALGRSFKKEKLFSFVKLIDKINQQ